MGGGAPMDPIVGLKGFYSTPTRVTGPTAPGVVLHGFYVVVQWVMELL